MVIILNFISKYFYGWERDFKVENFRDCIVNRFYFNIEEF